MEANENSVSEKIEFRKNQMFFGLAVEAFEKMRKDETKTMKLSYIKIEEYLPNNFRDFTQVFLFSHTHEPEDFWNWDFILENIPEGKVSIIDVMGKLEQYYVIKALKILTFMSKEEIDDIDLNFNDEYNRDLAYLAKDKLIKILDSLSDDPTSWDFIIGSEEIEKISDFRELLKKSEIIWEKRETERIRNKEVSIEKINDFKKEAIETFNEWSYMRNILSFLDLYVSKINEFMDVPRFGINRIEDKAVFFDKWHISYPNWAYNYGKNIAIGENTKIFQFLLKNSKKIEDNEITEEGLVDLLKDMNLSSVIIFISGYKSNQFFIKSKNFKRKGYSKFKPELNKLDAFKGYYYLYNRYIPVFSSVTNNIDKIVIVNKNYAFKLIQYSPLGEDDEKQLLEDIFYINIRIFNEDLLRKYIGASIDWLQDLGDEEAQADFLREKVWIEMIERFYLKIDKNFEGYFFEMK